MCWSIPNQGHCVVNTEATKVTDKLLHTGAPQTLAKGDKLTVTVERIDGAKTALSPVIGYDKASQIAHYALDNDLTLKQAALKLNYVSSAEFDRVVDPKAMTTSYVAAADEEPR
jgi:fumarate hydratase class II